MQYLNPMNVKTYVESLWVEEFSQDRILSSARLAEMGIAR